MSCSNDTHECCSHGSGTGGATQSMVEMNHERGLWGAAGDGDIQRVRTLLRKGRDPNAKDPYGYTALHYAARNGHCQVVGELLSGGARPSERTNGGATPAHRAAFKGHEKVLQLLLPPLRAGGAVYVVDDDGDTIVHKAAKGGHALLAEKLVKDFPQLDSIQNRRGHSWRDVSP